MKCPFKYIMRLVLLLLLLVMWIPITLWDGLCACARGYKANLKHNLLNDLPQIKEDFLKALRGEAFF